MKQQWLDWIKAFLIAGVLAIVVRVFLFAPVVVEGPSMLTTLHSGDHLIVSKLNYTLGSPERFDIVVFHATERKDYIKRVIGLPGDYIAYKDDQLYVNGKAVDEPFLEERKQQLNGNRPLTEDFKMEELPGEYQEVPEGYLFVLGDNRNNSTDSRMLGMIDQDQMVGEAVISYWPLNRIQLVN
ncbi:signal peptidase I [Halobacillus karajensis]|uniref:Signal peptidase I n=1 Tax=Halobacillus karajensis TaxID=195088 RepID=A0A024P1P1_9BACI|nr:signal peptidase I [Halobacillus karajensis]CDQ19759.1 Signal peptidase IB [Halobacillus karajensis]CDQ22219.1 Signal peptidase IB [Halobacillus karajensis]CDQ28060.1 Signal peptidase IB [Halobacillus karajensis]SEH72647.1 signal peptidase I [Halobacillus karajensis]